MRNVAICGSKVKDLTPGNNSISTIEIAGMPITCGVIMTSPPIFNAAAEQFKSSVLLKVRGFSCNYRDLNFILAAARKGINNSFFPFGSDVVGEVIDVGSEVARFQVGDRVINNNHFSGGGSGRAPEGVTTNQASREYQIIHADKLIKIPDEMPDTVAAGFGVGAQTAYSMIRKLRPRRGSNVLVTAAKSNTSLFIINALKKYGVNLYAVSTSASFAAELRELGVRQVIRHDPAAGRLLHNEQMAKILLETGLFETVFDPFFDLYLDQVVEVMAPNGRYVTCGLYEQFQTPLGKEPPDYKRDFRRVMTTVMTRNLSLIGNCLGATTDLCDALQDYEAGNFKVVIDKTFAGTDVAAFLHRTYEARDRFGKVVYQFI
jgi:NADPH:quinone reductase-like Zn-dependent oxidoreductase